MSRYAVLTFHADFSSVSAVDTPLLAVFLSSPERGGNAVVLPDALAPLDASLGGAISRTLSRRDFRGARDEQFTIVGATQGAQRVLLIGLGGGVPTRVHFRRAGAVAARAATRLGVGALHAYYSAPSAEQIEGMIAGIGLGAWSYTDLKTLPAETERRAPLTEASVMLANDATSREGFARGEALAAGQALARRLGMMPGNYCTPDTFVDTARDIASRFPAVQVTVLGREEMEREGMGSFLCVAQGTPQEPRLVAMEYRGGRPGDAPVVLIGKGLCFDTGGISIKPAQDMEWMKYDMSGAGGVMGAMESIARLALPINVVGIVGATTNMPSGTAVKPGDVVRASNGKTIEIINTDAEGRLVLADLLVFAKRYKPAAVLNAATLTGAIVMALGHQAVGLFGNNDALLDEVRAAGDRCGERGWPLPMWDAYKEQIRSDVADVRNTGGRPAGSITAALFLQEFVDGFPWVHLDVAGTAYSQSDLGWIPKGPTGTPVGTFVEFVLARSR
jgi:leucyl aminopeptidase